MAGERLQPEKWAREVDRTEALRTAKLQQEGTRQLKQ
jgi:hypothetical protein